jgi:DNA-binding transcriptional ArsR family regulator
MSAAELRALGHPLRMQLLQLLHTDGPSTASGLARKLGESSGATSYHLRALHRAGMIEEAEQRNSRERWWRRVPSRTMIPNSIAPDAPPDERLELQTAHARIESIIVERDEQALQRWESIRYSLPLELQDATWIGNNRIWLTTDELAALMRSLLEAVEPYRRADRPAPGKVEVHFTLRLLPQEGTAT